MKLVRMLQDVSGTRDGVPWPPAGEKISLPDEEADAAIAGDLAEEVPPEIEPPAAKSAPATKTGK